MGFFPLFVIVGFECGGGKGIRAISMSMALGPARGAREGSSGTKAQSGGGGKIMKIEG